MTAHKRHIEHLLNRYQALDHQTMAACYHEAATFRDIAFRLTGRKQIHAMWAMICQNGITVKVESVEEHGDSVRARIVDEYIFSETKRPVVNRIESTFQFRDGLIIAHDDSCDALDWARQAFGGLKGEIAGRCAWLRQRAARKMIRAYIVSHPEYA
jgi:ketosteroid isomerase-like protein